jgi:hypothetical protein
MMEVRWEVLFGVVGVRWWSRAGGGLKHRGLEGDWGVGNAIECEISETTKRTNVFTQSLLAKAFKGDLLNCMEMKVTK